MSSWPRQEYFNIGFLGFLGTVTQKRNLFFWNLGFIGTVAQKRAEPSKVRSCPNNTYALCAAQFTSAHPTSVRLRALSAAEGTSLRLRWMQLACVECSSIHVSSLHISSFACVESGLLALRAAEVTSPHFTSGQFACLRWVQLASVERRWSRFSSRFYWDSCAKTSRTFQSAQLSQ